MGGDPGDGSPPPNEVWLGTQRNDTGEGRGAPPVPSVGDHSGTSPPNEVWLPLNAALAGDL